MLRSIDSKKVSRENIENVKIFRPQMIKRRGCTEADEKDPEKWEKWEKFADRVFNATQVDASAAKRLWYKRSEVHARLQKWIYDLNLSSHQEYQMKRETHPSELFYNKDGRKRSEAEVQAKIQELKSKRHKSAKDLEDWRREREERDRHDRGGREDRRDRDRDRRSRDDEQEHRKRDGQDVREEVQVTKRRKLEVKRRDNLRQGL